jgi:hypothetical protein
MKNLKLYIDNQLADLEPNNLSYAITKQITDYNDISKRTGDFSYTVKVPLTKTNQKIFKFINVLDVINKFNKNKHYECSFYVNDNLMIEGYFNYTYSDERYFYGYISNKISGIFNLFGDKTLQDLTLPTIPFEGVMIPITTSAIYTPYNPGNNVYEMATDDVLQKDLVYDFQALMKGYKNDLEGNIYSVPADYRDYYSTSLIAYNNFYTSKTDFVVGKKSITNFLSYENFMPQIKLEKVLEALFKDIGFTVDLQLGDFNGELVLPYVGDTSPEWNYAHIASCSFSTVLNYTSILSATTAFDVLGYIKNPLITSNYLRDDTETGNIVFQNRKTVNYTSYTPQYSDQVNLGLNMQDTTITDINTYLNDPTSTFGVYDFDCCMAVDKAADYKAHYIYLNNIQYDFSNNFNYYSNPSLTDTSVRDGGQIYTVPASGRYSFDISNFHNISRSNASKFGDDPNNPANLDTGGNGTKIGYRDIANYKTDKTKIALGNVVAGYENNNPNTGTWIYPNREEFAIGNMVMLVKVDGDDLSNEDSSLMQSIKDTFRPFINQGFGQNNTSKYTTSKKLMNIKNDNVIAFYSPMLRDLFIGSDGVPRTWEEYVDAEKSILKNNQTYPITEDDKLKYFGFGEMTTIKGFENNITSTWKNITSLVAKEGFADPVSGRTEALAGYSTVNTNYNATEQLKRKLVRTYLDNPITRAQIYEPGPPIGRSSHRFYPRASYASGQVNWKFEADLNKGEQLRMIYITVNQYGLTLEANNFQITGTGKNYYKQNGYQDYFGDEIRVDKFKIDYISNTDKELKLSNFLPAIKQKDFIQDFIKSNNLYFDIKDNNITFQKRKDFIGKVPQKDLTGNVDNSRINISPVENFKTIQYGFKPSDNDDYKDLINSVNPVLTVDNGNNIYLKNQLLDLSSTIFKSSTNLDYRFYNFDIVYGNKFIQTDTITNQTIINITSFNEGGSSLKALDELDSSLDRNPRLVYHNDVQILNNNEKFLFNQIPFKYVYKDVRNSISNVGILLNTNRVDFFNDTFSNLQDSCYVELYVYLNETEFSKLDLSKPVNIDNSLYYIQKIDAYNPLANGLTKLILLRL